LATHSEYNYVPYQQERIAPALEAVERGEIQKLLILIPPGHAKSDWTSRSFPSWYLGRNPTKGVIGLSYSSNLAVSFGQDVRDNLRNPLHCELFPKGQLSISSRARNEFRTISGGRYNAVGFNGSVFGLRADGIVIDDPLKNMQEARSLGKGRYEFYKGIVKSRLRPGGWIVACMTRLGVGDFVHHLLENEADEWEVLKIPAEEDGRYLWEEHYGKKHYEQAKKDSRSWASIYMQDPVSGFGGPWFAEIPMEFYDEDVKPGKFPAFMVCDPAIGVEAIHDRTCIMVLCTTPGKKILVADCVLDRLDPDQRTAALIRLVRRWQPRKLLYEEYGLLSDSFHLNKAFKDAGISLRPIPVGRKGPRHLLAKEDRIRELIIDHKDGTIVYPRALPRKLVNGEVIDLMEYFRDVEYNCYAGEGSTVHDEWLDCISRIHDPEMMLRYPEAASSPLDDEDGKGKITLWPGGKPATSWESIY
jgi:hypothetical protein